MQQQTFKLLKEQLVENHAKMITQKNDILRLITDFFARLRHSLDDRERSFKG